MDKFTIRDYCEETDFETYYARTNDYRVKTLSQEVCGVSLGVDREEFQQYLRRRSHVHNDPKTVADSQNRPIGYALRAHYSRATRHNAIELMLWERSELTESVLREMLADAFDHGFSSMAVCRFHGWDTYLLSACRNIGMEEAGCIPDDYCYDGKLYPEYSCWKRGRRHIRHSYRRIYK